MTLYNTYIPDITPYYAISRYITPFSPYITPTSPYYTPYKPYFTLYNPISRYNRYFTL